MKKKIVSLLFVAFSLSAVFVSCKKDKSGTDDTTTAAEASTQSDDQSRFSSQVDAVADDVNSSLEASGSLITGKTTGTICDATIVVDSTSSPRTITITYDGTTSCHPAFSRTGVVVVSIPAGVYWKDLGARITVTYDSLKITRTRDGKSMLINGSHTVTNVKGGLLRDLATLGTSIVHTIESSGMTITFDDGTVRSWQVAKRREFTYSGGVIISTRGTHTDGAKTDISEWGTNRKGRVFTCEITTPLVVRQDCDYRLVSGVTLHTNPLFTAETTYGLDATGAATSCPGTTGTYYFKVVWTGVGGGSKTIIMPY
jgi:hypothetical protein